MNYNTFRNDRIVKQKKLYGYKIVAMGPKFFETQISIFKCFLTTFSTVKTLQKQKYTTHFVLTITADGSSLGVLMYSRNIQLNHLGGAARKNCNAGVPDYPEDSLFWNV